MTRSIAQKKVLANVSALDGDIQCESQATIGLGIISQKQFPALKVSKSVAATKDVSFFDTKKTSELKPPPPITVRTHSLERPDHEVAEGKSFADRIRALVSGKKRVKRIAESSTALEAASQTANTTEPVLLHGDEIVPLPSPTPPSLQRKSTFPLHEMHSPVKLDSAISLIAVSSNFSHCQDIIMPTLQEDPLLGEIEIAREEKYPSPEIDIEDHSLIGKHIWKYRIKHVLGVGAFSTVYLAEDLDQGGFFAVKTINKERMLLDPSLRNGVEREVHLLKVKYIFIVHDLAQY
jgi:hypothetical protein